MNDELKVVLEKLPKQLEQYNEISGFARGAQYKKAIESLKASDISESTKVQLGKALETGDKYLVGRILEDLDMRISQALCWGCWR